MARQKSFQKCSAYCPHRTKTDPTKLTIEQVQPQSRALRPKKNDREGTGGIANFS